MSRQYSFFDRLIGELDHAVRTVVLASDKSARSNPAGNIESGEMSSKEKEHAARLMRVNLTGEVCAQALYRGQASVAKSEETRAHLLEAADEEQDHLAWCSQRIKELDNRRSYLDIIWYANSFLIGQVAARVSDELSLGFVMETENQVMQHLESHLDGAGSKGLPKQDLRSRKIIEVMKEEEMRHADDAKEKGGKELSKVMKAIMKLQSKVMTGVVYYI